MSNRVLLTIVFAVAASGGAAAPSSAKSYAAERFDVRARIEPGGAMEITETIVFRFESGTFREVFRRIPQRRTDGVEILNASMDGAPMPFGDGPGQVEVRRRSDVRVTWHLPRPVSGSTHTFTLTYRAHGAVRQSDDGDLLAWRLLPTDHNYAIDSATLEVEGVQSPAAEPVVETRRVARARRERADGRLIVRLEEIRRDGWAEIRLVFPQGSVIAEAPGWQRSAARAAALAPRWLAAAGIVFAAALIPIWALRQGYDSPGRSHAGPQVEADPPDRLRPAAAGALASNGRVSLVHAMGTLFELADRGALSINEEKALLGSRSYVLERRATPERLAAHEQQLLDIVFTHKGAPEPRVTLVKARSRLASRLRDFRRALAGELLDAGLLDRERQQTYGRLGRVSIALLVLGGVGFPLVVPLLDEYRAWPLVIPTAIVLASLVGFVVQGATTPLSNDGVRRRERWRAHKRHLTSVARHELQLTSDSPSRVLPIAVALGIASLWSKFVKAHPAATPLWFRAVSQHERDDAFAAFVAYGGAGGGGAAGGAGAAGGGGASGAS